MVNDPWDLYDYDAPHMERFDLDQALVAADEAREISDAELEPLPEF